jgi:hypothetical protein
LPLLVELEDPDLAAQVNYERNPENFLGMLHLACCLILIRGL